MGFRAKKLNNIPSMATTEIFWLCTENTTETPSKYTMLNSLHTTTKWDQRKDESKQKIELNWKELITKTI